MLKKLGDTIDISDAVVAVKDAAFPTPFASQLEFNAPVHGNWNIVHTGMLLPQAHQIYVCADNCMRGVVLTAAEMNAADRFSFVIIEEEHLLNGNLEDITIEGVADVLKKLSECPKAVLLFTVCLHHFLGCDLERVYQELEERFPDIVFIRCYMDPIMQKTGLTPDQKLRKALYDPLQQRKADAKTVTLLGSDFVLDESSDLVQLLQKNGYTLKELPNCHSWEEYLELSRASLFLSCYPPGRYGAEELADRLGRKHLYLPACFGYEEISSYLNILADALGLPQKTFEEQIESCEKALEQAKQEIGDMPITLDYMFHPRPLGLARLLISHGFVVKTVYLDAISPEEQEDFVWLQAHAPELELAATIHVKMRVLPRGGEREVLAIGQKAAWFCRSSHFVNMVQGGGLYGFDGIRRLTRLMVEAFREEKDTEALVVQKGWGCECSL